ncbi:MAG TPA: 4Fe-4S dicluster domain-containing protein [Bacteroidales bacterium]|nr:4Fe-4S dicluster domain-containing protein [Bacteroidales bacterium]HSA43301.1 4Fe-4S dicluster domain-containing protein [Bacteroidales bacterium]
MGLLYDRIHTDVRFEEGLNACIHCGTCTAICPAAAFYPYDPREIVDICQSGDELQLEKLLKSETIWCCGECMSCVTRCPRGNKPGLLILSLRSLSQDMGYFVESEKGRQQLAIKRTIGQWMLDYGYCLYAPLIKPVTHPEQGPVWEWELDHLEDVMGRLGANYKKDGPGVLRNIPKEALEEIRKIFEVTGGLARYEQIEQCSAIKAEEMGLELGDARDTESEYFNKVFRGDYED